MIDRRRTLALMGSTLGWVMAARAGAAPVLAKATPFSWEWLKGHAKTIASAKPRPLPKPVPGAQAIDYDAVNRIRYRADRTIGADNGYGARLFPLSRYANSPVELYTVANGVARHVEHEGALFEIVPGEGPAPRPLDGVAGLRLINKGGVGDWLAFLGASYFRSAGALDQYGLSARGLAIDTGIDGREEFPQFTAFWIAREAPGSITIYALLEGPSVVGAYRFVNRDQRPKAILQDVSCQLFFRKDVERLGVAPLTSMFWYDEGNRPQAIDWRPEIHDSDCLLIHNGAGERICRPLGNPPHATINSFSDTSPKGFGLLQRDRAFDHYQDDGVYYHKRPSLWVEPKGDWGEGAVSLYEIPTRREVDDNIVAFWTPAAPVRAGAAMSFDYRLNWIGGEPDADPLARVVDRWTGIAGRPGHDPLPDARRIVIDFEGRSLKGLDRQSGVRASVTVDRGKVISADAYPVVGTASRWRLIVDSSIERQPVNLRATLEIGDRAVTETVIHQFY